MTLSLWTRWLAWIQLLRKRYDHACGRVRTTFVTETQPHAAYSALKGKAGMPRMPITFNCWVTPVQVAACPQCAHALSMEEVISDQKQKAYSKQNASLLPRSIAVMIRDNSINPAFACPTLRKTSAVAQILEPAQSKCCN